jgi:hypothetical protein
VADITVKWLAKSPADFWSAIVEAFKNFAPMSGADSWSMNLVVDDKGPAIDMVKDFTDSDYHYHWLAVWDDASWQTPVPNRPWASYCGTSGELAMPDGGPFGIGVPMADYWEALANITKDWLSEATDAASVTLLDQRVVLTGGVQILTGAMVFILDKDLELPTYIVWAVQWNNETPDEGGQYRVAGFPRYSPCIAPITNAVYTGSALASIAESLDAFSLADFEQSINHGSAMWSLRGKVRVG